MQETASIPRETESNSTEPQVNQPIGPSPISKSTPPKPFRLFDLPVELCLYICELVVTEPVAITINHDAKPCPWGCERCTTKDVRTCTYNKRQPAISKVNRYLRETCLPLFYRKTIFHAVSWSVRQHATSWLDAIGEHNRKDIRRFYISCLHPQVVGSEWFTTSIRSAGISQQEVEARDVPVCCDGYVLGRESCVIYKVSLAGYREVDFHERPAASPFGKCGGLPPA